MSPNDEVEDALDVDVLVNEFCSKNRKDLGKLLRNPESLMVSIQLLLHDHGLKGDALDKAAEAMRENIKSAARTREIIDEVATRNGWWDCTRVITDPKGHDVVIGHIPRRRHWGKDAAAGAEVEDRQEAI